MKGIMFLVCVALLSVAYGTYCPETANLHETCQNNGKCAEPQCVDKTKLTTTAGPTTPGANPSQQQGTPAPQQHGNQTQQQHTTHATQPAVSSAVTTAPTAPAGRKRRAPTTATPATCKSSCSPSQVCRYQCTVQSGSIKYGLSPLVLVIGVVTKLFIG